MFIHDHHVEYESSNDEEDEDQDEKIVSNSKAVEKCLSWMPVQNE